MAIPEGVYNISRNTFFKLQHAAEERTPIVTLPIDVNHPTRSEWRLTKLPNGNYTIQNEAFDEYFIAPEENEENSELIGTEVAFEWRMQPTGQRNVYHIVVPGGPIDGEELTADYPAGEQANPPTTALRPLNVATAVQGWKMTKLRD